MDLTYSSLNAHLLAVVPELEFPFRQLVRDWDGEQPGPHVVYGDLLLPWLLDRIRERDEGRLRSVFEFLDLLASHHDIEVQNVLAHSVFEPGLSIERSLHRRARRLMPPALLEMSNDFV